MARQTPLAALHDDLVTCAARRPRVLVFVHTYLPGFKAGGPIRTIANLVDALGDELDFSIVTSDRDLGETQPYEGVQPHVWTRVGKARVMYLSPGWRSAARLMDILRQSEPDVVYLNSLFSRLYSMVPMLLMWLGVGRRTPVLLAPKGELSQGALAINSLRKRVYVACTRWMYRRVTWHACTGFERQDILRECSYGEEASALPCVLTACDLPAQTRHGMPAKRVKRTGDLSVAFVSRISPMKNLLGALEALAGLNGRVRFDIYGPLEDHPYWQRCGKVIEHLPPNILVRYCGEISHDHVHGSLSEHDVFLLPSLGESYGHVIPEALLAGCPVVISDQTPWRNLEAYGAGWDLPLSDLQGFRTVLQRCLDMPEQEFAALQQHAYAYGVRALSNPALIQESRRLLLTAAGQCGLTSNDQSLESFTSTYGT